MTDGLEIRIYIDIPDIRSVDMDSDTHPALEECVIRRLEAYWTGEDVANRSVTLADRFGQTLVVPMDRIQGIQFR